MRPTLILVWALSLDAAALDRAWAAQACAWIVEQVDDEGDHQFHLNLSVDAPTSVAVRFQGANFTSASMGGDMIALVPGEAKDVDEAGFEVSAGDDLHFEARLYDRPMASLDEMDNPTGNLLATFVFDRKVGEDEHTAPPDLAVKQCKALG